VAEQIGHNKTKWCRIIGCDPAGDQVQPNCLKAKLSALLIVWASLFTSACRQDSDTGQKTIRIAANLPMTGSLAIYGQSIKDGAEMAVEDFKRTDPTGPSFAIDWQDNASTPQTAVSIFQRQMLSEYDIYWSGVKPETSAIQDQVEARGMPHFVWVFDAYVNNKKSGADASTRNTFRTWVNFKIEPSVLLAYVKAHQAKKVGIVYVRLPNTEEEYQKIMAPALKAMGINDVLMETYDANGADYKSIAVKVREFKPDVIILSGFQDNFVGLVRAFRPLGLIENGNTICSYDLLDAAKLLGKDELEDLHVVAPMFATHADNARIKGWSERFRRRTNHLPLYTNAYAYDAITMIYAAAHRLMLPASSEQWIRALRATKLDGVTGPLVFDEDGSLVTPVEVGVYKDGALLPESQSKE
jgi:branched-chain amino acid transport system substrate-binding protein